MHHVRQQYEDFAWTIACYSEGSRRRAVASGARVSVQGIREPDTHLSCRHFEAGISHGLEALHEPVSARRGCSLDWVKVPPVCSNRVWDLQDAPAWPGRTNQLLPGFKSVKVNVFEPLHLCVEWSIDIVSDVFQALQLCHMEAAASARMSGCVNMRSQVSHQGHVRQDTEVHHGACYGPVLRLLIDMI